MPDGLISFFKVSRWLHVYCSTALFALLIFFSVTGIFLNHSWYHQSANTEIDTELEISDQQFLSWNLAVGEDWAPDTTAIVQYSRQAFGLPAPSSMDIDADFGELIIEYLIPAGFATVIVDANAQLMWLEIEKGSAVGILNDLHKGRYSGQVWSWVIDLSAGLMCLFAITGLIILFHGKKYQKAGVISALLGLVTPVLIYFLFVPTVSV